MGEQEATRLELTAEQRAVILRVAAKHGARHVRVFGSAARGEATAQSDIDLLVDKGTETSPWFPAGLILELISALFENGSFPAGKTPVLKATAL